MTSILHADLRHQMDAQRGRVRELDRRVAQRRAWVAHTRERLEEAEQERARAAEHLRRLLAWVLDLLHLATVKCDRTSAALRRLLEHTRRRAA